MIWLLSYPIFWGLVFHSIAFGSFPPRDAMEWILFGFMLPTIFSIVATLPFIGIAAFIGSWPKTYGKPARLVELMALRQQDGFSGRFFLGSGMIQDSQYYFWYSKNEDGSISGGKTYRSPDVRVYQFKPESGEHPRMQFYVRAYRDELWGFLLGGLFGMDFRDDNYAPDFHIPEGSIIEGYQL